MSSTTDNEQRFAYLLSPEFEIVNTAGKPLTGGWIEVYLHGTRNKYYCFSDFDGTLHPFQIPLDSLGSNIVLASPLHAYDVYIYNKFGALVMSRYNIVPATNSSDAIADIIVIDSPNETINVTIDGGTNWHLDVNTDLIATASGLAEVSGNLQDQIDNKKDLQLPYVASGTVTKTITKIEQNENGEIEVTYEDIDLPPQVPNIDIISPSGTIDVTSTINPATNTKTFKIDIHKTKMDFFDGYGGRNRNEYRSSSDMDYFGLYVDQWREYKYQGDFITNSWQDENNINFVLNSGLYLITASIRYQMNSDYNQEEYIRIATGAYNGLENGTRYKDWSNEVALGEDFDESSIQVSFIRNVEDDDDYTYMNGNHYLYFMPELPMGVRHAFIDHLQIVKLDSIAAFSGGSGQRYIPGYGIEIIDDVIQVATGTVITNNYFNTVVSSINNEINEISTTIQNVTGDITELSEAVTNIVGVTGDFVNRDEYNAVTGDITNINEAITNIIGATGDYATTDYVDAAVSGLENYSAGQYISIEDHVISVTGLQPEGDYATRDELNEVIETVNNVTGDITNINEAITNIIGATGDYATEEYVDEAIAAVTGQPLQQQQSDWTQQDDTKVDYIKHKPREVNLVAGDHIAIEQQDLDVIISATGIGDVYNAGQFISIQNGTISATGVQPAGNYATEQYVDEAVAAVTGQPFEQVNSDWLATSGKAEILNKPDVFQLIAGDNIDITPSGNDLVISASSDVTKAYVDEQIAVATGMIPEDTVSHTELNDAIDAATGMIPSDVVTHVELNDVVDTVTGMIPDVSNFVTQHDIDDSIAPVQSQIDTLAAATGDYITSLDGYATEQYVNDAIATVTGIIPSDVVTEQELANAIDAATGLIPQDTITHTELANAIDSATGLIPDVSNFVTQQDVDNTVAPIQSEIDDLVAATGNYVTSLDGYATEQYVDEAIAAVTGIIPSDVVTEQELSDAIDAATGLIPDVAPIQSQIDTLAAATGDYIQSSDLNGYATEQYVDASITAATGLIPQDTVTHVELNDAIDAATGLIPDISILEADIQTVSGAVDYVSGAIPESEEIEFEELDLSIYALASAVPDITQLETDVANLAAATGDYLQSSDLDGYATEQYVSAVSGALETDIQAVSGAIPEAKEVQFKEVDLSVYATEAYVDAAVSAVSFEQVNADWTATSGVAEILNKPETEDITVCNVIAGDNISITASGDDIVISAQGGGATYTAGDNIDITNDTISVTGTEDLTLMPITGVNGVNITNNNGVITFSGSSDETTLWSGTFSGSTGSGNYITLSEATTNFNTIEITMGDGYKTKLRYDGASTTWQVFSPYVDSTYTGTVIYALMYQLQSNNTQVYCKGITLVKSSGWSASSSMNVGEVQLTKVVGIGRK